ncbi:MAG: lyase [Pseudomonadota bacterium]
MRLSTSLAAALSLAAPAAAQDMVSDGPLKIEEWRVPYEASRPRDPFAESATSVWFVGQRTGYLARLDVEIGAMEKVDLPEGEGPHNLIVGRDGVVWYAGNRTGVIGRYDPKTGEIEEIPTPDEAARDPHTLIFDEREANIWFTVQGGNFMGRMDIRTRKVDLIPSQTERSRPYGIKLAPDGYVWVVLFGTNKLARIHPKTLALTEIKLPREGARPRRLEVGKDGRVWYVDYAEGRLGAYDPKADAFKEWPMPSGGRAQPYGTAMDKDGDIWFVETGVEPNLFTGFDPETETFFAATPVPSGGGTLRHMHYHEGSGAVWFGADTNTVGRAFVDAVAAPGR